MYKETQKIPKYNLNSQKLKEVKNDVILAGPCKLTSEIRSRTWNNIALGLPYSLAAESAGITYQTFNYWRKRGRLPKSSYQR
jgi:hypothetical protein